MKHLRKLAMEKKNLVYWLVALVALGAFSLILSPGGNWFSPSSNEMAEFGHMAEEPAPLAHTPQTTKEPELAAQLEEFLSMVEGAGQVRVMLSPGTGRETIYAVDTNSSESSTVEKDAQGGTREVHQNQLTEKTVMITDRQGTDRPLILREIPDRAQGIVIIAEGGACPFVRDALTRAAVAILGMESHRVQVLAGNF